MEKNRFCSIGIAGLSLLFSFSTVLAQQREPQVLQERSSVSRLVQQSDRKEVSANQGFSLMENSARIVPPPSRKMLGLPKESLCGGAAFPDSTCPFCSFFFQGSLTERVFDLLEWCFHSTSHEVNWRYVRGAVL